MNEVKTVSLEELLKKYRGQLKNLKLSKISVELELENDVEKIAKDVRWSLICVQMRMIEEFLKDFEAFVVGLRKIRNDFPVSMTDEKELKWFPWFETEEWLERLDAMLKETTK